MTKLLVVAAAVFFFTAATAAEIMSSKITAAAAASTATTAAAVALFVMNVMEFGDFVWFGHMIFDWDVFFDDVWDFLFDWDLDWDWDVFVDLDWKETKSVIWGLTMANGCVKLLTGYGTSFVTG